jgi:hypothetical protein
MAGGEDGFESFPPQIRGKNIVRFKKTFFGAKMHDPTLLPGFQRWF